MNPTTSIIGNKGNHQPSVITRFAPSPTGHLHIGGVRTALFCWAWAKRNNGHFLLRIEDTDQKRSSDDAAKGMLEDLAWLGINWDEGPVFAPSADSDQADGSKTTLGGDPRGVGPFYQARRLDIYQHFIDQLLERQLAFPAFETAEELDAQRANARAAKETWRYRRRPDYDHQQAMACMKACDEKGTPYVIRFCMPREPIVVHDEVLGEIVFDEQHTDDFVIRKADGYPTYHLAVVVDDELMGVTHILRGQEHLNNTPRHVALQQALTRDDGSPFRTPIYAHMPLIFNADGSKMSKRDKDKACRKAFPKEADLDTLSKQLNVDKSTLMQWKKDKTRQLPTSALQKLATFLQVTLPEIDVEDFRASGYLPEVLCNYLALLGWNPGMKNDDGTDLERFDMAFLAEHFSLDRIGKTNARFDRDKLISFNQATIARLDEATFVRVLCSWCERYDPVLLETLGDRMTLAARAIQPRIKTLSQAREPIDFALKADDAIEFDPKAVKKALHKGDPSGLSLLEAFAPTLETITPFEPQAIEQAVKVFCEAHGVGMGKLAGPLRVAMTGTMVSPGLGQTLALVGKRSAIIRVKRCLERCQSVV